MTEAQVLALVAEAERLKLFRWRYEKGGRHFDKWFAADSRSRNAAHQYFMERLSK